MLCTQKVCGYWCRYRSNMILDYWTAQGLTVSVSCLNENDCVSLKIYDWNYYVRMFWRCWGNNTHSPDVSWVYTVAQPSDIELSRQLRVSIVTDCFIVGPADVFFGMRVTHNVHLRHGGGHLLLQELKCHLYLFILRICHCMNSMKSFRVMGFWISCYSYNISYNIS